MTYTRETINEYLKEHKKAIEQENWHLANAPAADFVEMIEQLLEEIDVYKGLLKGVCQGGYVRYYVREESGKYYIHCYDGLSDYPQWKIEPGDYTTEQEAWDTAFKLAIENLPFS